MTWTRAVTVSVRWVPAMAALVLIGSVAVRACVHRHDLANMQHISGIWMALAWNLNSGTFYPPLEADGYTAGTRYMPALFVLLAILTRVLGDYLLAAKMLALANTAALAVVVFLTARRLSGSTLLAATASGALFALPEVAFASLALHQEALAAALSLAGLWCLDRHTSWGWVVAASALFALALLTKFSAASAFTVGVGLLFGRGNWRLAAGLGLLTIGGFTLALIWIEAASQGRFSENVLALASGGMTREHLGMGLVRLLLAVTMQLPTAILVTVGAVVVAGQALSRKLSLWEAYAGVVAASLVVIFMSPGTNPNHLVELEAALVVVLARAATTGDLTGRLARATLVVLVALGLGAEYSARADRDESAILATALPDSPAVLSDDATVPILRGKRPIVMDAFAFRHLASRGRIDPQPLADRIRREEFQQVILLDRLEEGQGSTYPQFHFGPVVTDALRAHYRFDHRLGRYYVYLPLGR